MEGVLVAVITATVAFFLIELIDDCSAQQDEKHTDNSLQASHIGYIFNTVVELVESVTRV